MTDLSKTNNRVVAALVGFLPMLTLAVPHGQAQDAPGVEAIDEIIVTTTRAPSARGNNPGNIAVLATDTTPALFPVKLLNSAPGVHIHRGSGQEHLTAIRSPVLVGGAGAGSFLYLEDGISLRAPGFANVNALMDVMPSAANRVEVVRGPGSALYGSNALHGLVNYISAPIEAGSNAALRVGSFGRYGVTGQGAQQDGDFATRLAVSATGDGGWRDESGFQQQKLRFQSQWGSDDTRYHFSFGGMNLNQETAGYIKTENCGDGTVEAYKIRACAKSNPNPEAYRDAQSWRAFLRMDRALANGGEVTVTPYWRSNDMEFIMHFLPGKAVEKNSHDSIGLQSAYQNGNDTLSYVIGVDMEMTQGELSEVQTAPPAGFGGYLPGTHYDFEVDALVVAPYAHIVWALGAATDITTGLRFERTEYDYTNNTDTGLQGKLFRPASQSNSFSDLSPKLGLLHRLNENARLFVNLARAARAPQVTDLYRLRDDDKTGPLLAPAPSAFDSETLDSLELGFRNRVGHAAYEVTYFVMRKENYHFRDGDDRYVTDGKTAHQGIELELDWQVTRTISLTHALTLASHEYRFNRILPDGNPNAAETIRDGNKIDGAPETLAATALSWYANDRLTAKLGWQHVGSYFMDASNSAEYDGHDIFSAELSYRMGNGMMARFNIENLTDKAYAKRADKWFGDNRYFPGEARNVTLTLQKRF